jgi:AcrR family transcriptional regulator
MAHCSSTPDRSSTIDQQSQLAGSAGGMWIESDLVLPAWPDATQKGRRIREQILRTTMQILVDDGFAALTLRRVSRTVGIHLSTLMHYYPTHDDLIAELMQTILETFRHQISALYDLPDSSPREHLENMLRATTHDLSDFSAMSLFFELWAESNRNPLVKDLLFQVYKSGERPLVEAIREFRTDLSEVEAERLCVLGVSLLEGLMVPAGPGRSYADCMPAFIDLTIGAFLQMVATVPAGKPDFPR